MLSVCLLAGCGRKMNLETVADVVSTQIPEPMGQVSVTFPNDAVIDVMESEDGATLYQCDGYSVTIQTLASGDMNRSLQTVSGYEKEELNLIATKQEGLDRYDWVFTAAGESGDQVFRCALLDDGNFHYVVTAMAPAETAGQLRETWNELFSTVCLVSTDSELPDKAPYTDPLQTGDIGS